MKLTLPGMFALKLVALVALLIGAISLASDTATAQTSDEVETGGTVGDTAGGDATIWNITDLNLRTNCRQPNSADYDDDPTNAPLDERYYVTPNLGDEPMKEACKYIFVRGPLDVGSLQVTIRTETPGTPGTEGGGTPAGPSDDVVFHADVTSPAVNWTETNNCANYLGDPTVPGTVAHGLVTTGQKTLAEITEFRNYCAQNTGAIYVVEWPVSKHLPPGNYWQCVAISHTPVGSTPRYCEQQIVINPITGFAHDVEDVDFGNLVFDQTSTAEGDWLWTDDTGNNQFGGGTVMGLGNTSPLLTVVYSNMVNDTADPGTRKRIESWFDIHIYALDDDGVIDPVRVDHEIQMDGGSDPDAADPFAGGDVATLSVCLEPNEPLKLDFTVDPQQPLWEGDYAGLVRLALAPASQGCVPGLDTGEDASGDTDVFDNSPQGAPLAS